MYDPYRPPTEPEPDDPAPRWEKFEPDRPRRRSRPASWQPRRGSGSAPGSRPASVTSGMVGIVGVLVVAGIGVGISRSGDDAGPSGPPAGWAECVAEEEAEIRARGGSLLEPEDFCAIRFPDYEWEEDPTYVGG
ncbi:hypothetical protein [Nocardioides bizhenqiangii]|uniref:Uncharacterized protein n=1 Tax=Nocardioides bizhenqiangii TaxID=3095076 RepID=A0ABZ0ZQJ4_9ACTN|nr:MULTISPECIES: hypothetical protein [unclassified Nocardioides]MDZ5619448.1 hypothetical protein [Nocardioides sp. HM23]WQQ26532.1 hypothetical protein SHK19_21580 [Nocardioides sp. HM61]